jgi:pilus assembly protein Flp/PilA
MLAELIEAFCDDEMGATAIEYGLLAALVAVAAIASFSILGNAVVNLMSDGTGSAAEVIGAQSEKLN